MAKPTQAPNNPFACASNAIKMHTVGPCCGTLLAVYGYSVKNQGDEITFTPLTGQSSPDLKYYRWTVFDKNGTFAGGVLDLNNPSANVVVNTSALDNTGPFVVKFAASKENGQEDAAVSYDLVINDITSGPSGTSTPSNYENVYFKIELQSTNDLNFTGFPTEGLIVQNGQAVNFESFLNQDLATKLAVGASYVFTFSAGKYWYSPSLASATPNNGDVIASATITGFPVALGLEPSNFWTDATLKTDLAGVYTSELEAVLTNEGVQPLFSITLNTNIGL